MDRTEAQARLEFWKNALTALRAAYVNLLEGGVKSYRINNRELTRFDLPELKNEIEEAEKKVDELAGLLSDKRPRKAFGVLPRDW
jgi:hypothetical protein